MEIWIEKKILELENDLKRAKEWPEDLLIEKLKSERNLLDYLIEGFEKRVAQRANCKLARVRTEHAQKPLVMA